MIDKAPDAYRTISEVADDLDLPQHVLRFWETKFSQIRPLKRGGGRRYYRPDDVELLKSIRHLLYNQGYTIKGVQRILKENGPKAVQAILHAPQQDDASDDETYDAVDEPIAAPPPPAQPVERSTAAPAQPTAAPNYRAPIDSQADDMFAELQPAPDVSSQPHRALETPQQLVQRPAVSFTRGGLRPIVHEIADSGPERLVVVPKPRVASPEQAQLSISPEPKPITEPENVPSPVRGGLSDAQRRALQSTLFELSECRRAIQQITLGDR